MNISESVKISLVELQSNKIRSLLLAGIRSAMLWRQCGGKRWQILLGRKRMLSLSHKLTKQAEAELAATTVE